MGGREKCGGELKLHEIDPEVRLAQLTKFGQSKEVNYLADINDILKDGINTVDMADDMFKKKDYENAYVLYLKFLEKFSKQVVHHPRYDHASSSNKSVINYKLCRTRKMLRILRNKLLKMYADLRDKYSFEHMENSEEASPVSLAGRKRSSIIRTIRNHSSSIMPFGSPSYLYAKNLRTLVVPNQLTTIFQIYTNRGLKREWAAIAGKKINGQYVITHLLISDQQPEDLYYLHEESHNEFMKKNDLIPLGWIDIHKTSSCYLSANDLHQLWKYQSGLAEAVSIICAPLFSEVAIYSLLEYGMEFIGNCKKLDFYHTHNAYKPLYSTPKHVKFVYNTSFEVVDLRKDRENARGDISSSNCNIFM